MAHPEAPHKSAWLFLIMAQSLLIAPCLWLAARETIDRAPPSRLVPGQHCWPIVIGWVLLLPLLSTSHSGVGFEGADAPSPLFSLFVHSTMLASALIFLVQTLIYTRLVRGILDRRCQENLNLFSTIDDRALNTLRIFLVAVLANGAIGAARVFNCATPGDDTFLAPLFAAGQAAVVAYLVAAVFSQEIAYRQQDQDLREATPTTAGKYSNSALSPAQRRQIEQKLAEAMEVDALYEFNELTLRTLCDHIGENTHHVSQAINEGDYANFYDLVNQHRIAAARRMLDDLPEQTILDIAFAVGFNSKSTFNAAFKRYAKLTPTQYRRRATQPTVVA